MCKRSALWIQCYSLQVECYCTHAHFPTTYRSADIQLSGGEEQDETENCKPSTTTAESSTKPTVAADTATSPADEAFDLITDDEIMQSMTESMIEPALHDPKYDKRIQLQNITK